MSERPEGPTPEEVDRQFEQIVAGFGPWQDARGSSGITLDDSTEAAAGPVPTPRSWGPRDYAVEEDTRDFVPPDPPALGSGRPAVVLSMVAVAGAPAVLLLASVLWRGMPALMVGVLVAVFVAGAAGLFLTLPRERDRRDQGPDDGARV